MFIVILQDVAIDIDRCSKYYDEVKLESTRIHHRNQLSIPILVMLTTKTNTAQLDWLQSFCCQPLPGLKAQIVDTPGPWIIRVTTRWDEARNMPSNLIH